jgi:hypothetical protein
MPYLPVVDGSWGYRNLNVIPRLPGVTDEQANEFALRDMCDYGARQIALGKADELEFRIWPNEKDYIDAYMAERHPKVLYRLRWPVCEA